MRIIIREERILFALYRAHKIVGKCILLGKMWS